ncbi:hypothetical protein PHMEG_00032085, partial [Phytophthora megakarya]
ILPNLESGRFITISISGWLKCWRAPLKLATTRTGYLPPDRLAAALTIN